LTGFFALLSLILFKVSLNNITISEIKFDVKIFYIIILVIMGTKSSKKQNRDRRTSILKLDEIDKEKIKVYKIVGGQNLPLDDSQNNILNPYFNIKSGFIDKFIEIYVLAYNIETVTDYINNLDYHLYNISVSKVKMVGNSLQFNYNPNKIPFKYRHYKKRKEEWNRTLNKIMTHKYVPMQIQALDKISRPIDINFLVYKQNYIVLV